MSWGSPSPPRTRCWEKLTSAGATERLPCGRYRLGWRTLGLARTKPATSGYREEITPTARRLASHFGETVHITALERGRVLYVASQRPPGGVPAPAEPVAAPLTADGTLSAVQTLSAAGKHASAPQVAVDADGDAVFDLDAL